MSDRFSSDVLSIDVDGHVATLWLDRPAARNALGPAFWADLPRAMAELSGDDRVRAVVVAARGPHFSVGLDLKAMAGLLSGAGDGDPSPSPAASSEAAPSPSAPSPAARARATRATVVRLQAAVTAVADCPKPVVAAVHGYCIGGGVDLITACDIRLASADAVFSVREAKVAIVARSRQPPAATADRRRRPCRGAGVHRPGRRRRPGTADRPGQRRRRRRRRGAGRRSFAGRGDRGQLARRRPGHEGRAGRQRRPNGGRRARLRRDVERRDARFRRPDGGDDRAFLEKRPPKFTGR